MSNINDYKITFTIADDWDEDPGAPKKANPVTLGEIIEYGMQTQLDFPDGTTTQFEDLSWDDSLNIDAEIELAPQQKENDE